MGVPLVVLPVTMPLWCLENQVHGGITRKTATGGTPQKGKEKGLREGGGEPSTTI